MKSKKSQIKKWGNSEESPHMVTVRGIASIYPKIYQSNASAYAATALRSDLISLTMPNNGFPANPSISFGIPDILASL